jgi:hypothetical protein
MHRPLSVFAACAALPAAPAATIAAPGHGSVRPSAITAKHCSSGYAHAAIGGAEKCLHGGE